MKIKITALIFSSCLLTFINYNSYSQSGWVNCTPETNAPYFCSVSFINDNTGYVLNMVGDVFKTTNGGNNWISIQSIYPRDVWDIEFIDEDTGFICGDYYCSILKTTNGGINWEVKKLTYLYLYDIKFVNTFTGFAVGETSNILKSTNCGENWFSLNGPSGYYYSISTIDTSNLYVCGYQVIYSSNNGNDWRVIGNNSGPYSSLCFVNLNTGVVTNYFGNLNIIEKTTNLGNSWISIDSDTLSCTNVTFVNSTTGFICGQNGLILKTTNIGNNWNKQVTNIVNRLWKIKFTSQNTGYCVGEGIVLKTTTGGEPIGIKPISEEIPASFELFQNYPNPFNPKTKIKFELPIKEKVELKIFDILGKEITTLVNGEMEKDYHEFLFDGSNLSSGIYFYRIKTDNFVESKKMLLIK
ncbi:MAG: T9SS C-terminal target domain-containing protein [Ignavibacteriae bacterium]|nr:MAG: T9SS C-terminal target domain-containing protein [Ignavibacteriota bacterium]